MNMSALEQSNYTGQKFLSPRRPRGGAQAAVDVHRQRGRQGLHHLVWEIVDNAVDEVDHHRREIAISALREWMAKVGQAKSVAVAFVGKLKTVAQMIAIPLLLFRDRLWGLDCLFLGTILINVAAVLTVVSMLYYCVKRCRTRRCAARAILRRGYQGLIMAAFSTRE